MGKTRPESVDVTLFKEKTNKQGVGIIADNESLVLLILQGHHMNFKLSNNRMFVQQLVKVQHDVPFSIDCTMRSVPNFRRSVVWKCIVQLYRLALTFYVSTSFYSSRVPNGLLGIKSASIHLKGRCPRTVSHSLFIHHQYYSLYHHLFQSMQA